jgi:hypothetical protein
MQCSEHRRGFHDSSNWPRCITCNRFHYFNRVQPIGITFYKIRSDSSSNNAQTVQAVVSCCLLLLAIFGYIYTVRPVYTKQLAEETAARLQRETNELRAESAALTKKNSEIAEMNGALQDQTAALERQASELGRLNSQLSDDFSELKQNNLEAKEVSVKLQEQTAALERQASELKRRDLRLAVDQFFLQVLADGANLLRTYDLYIDDLLSAQSRIATNSRFKSGIKPIYASCLGHEQSISALYEARMVSVRVFCLSDDLRWMNTGVGTFSKYTAIWENLGTLPKYTGSEIIKLRVDSPKTELSSIDADDRNRIAKRIHQFADDEPTIREVLIFRKSEVPIVLPLDFVFLTDEDRMKIQVERDRQENAHRSFIQAMDKLKQLLDH